MLSKFQLKAFIRYRVGL